MILNKIMIEPPDEGQHLAVLVDIFDLGTRNTVYGPKDQLRCKWLVQQRGKDGKELSVVCTYTKSLGQKANLLKAITDITGTPPTDGFDTESLIGANARLIIKHKPTPDGRVYANVIAILRPGKKDPKLPIPAWFKRAGADDRGGAAVADPTAPVQPAPKPVAVTQAPPEPPDTGEWNPADYDAATAFLPDNHASGGQAD